MRKKLYLRNLEWIANFHLLVRPAKNGTLKAWLHVKGCFPLRMNSV